MFSKGTPLTESSSGNYEYTIEDLAPDTEYHVRLMIQKEGKLSLDVTYVNFQTEKVRQEAPNAADVSINYEQETLENKASCDLEYAASKDAQSWTIIRQGGKVRLTGLLNNIREMVGLYQSIFARKHPRSCQPVKRFWRRICKHRRFRKNRTSRILIIGRKKSQFPHLYSM